MIEAPLRTYLMAIDDLTDIIGTRLYPMIVPQSAPLPYVVYRRTGTEREYTEHGSHAGLAIAAIDFEAYADGYEDVKELSEVLRQAFDGHSGTLGTYERISILLTDESDLVEPLETATESPVYGVRLSIDITFHEE